jgi:LAO/AO transport system kinase
MGGKELASDLLKGDPRALAQLISLLEDRGSGYSALIDEIYPHTGRAYRVGITGPPGAGKSTLVDKLVPLFRKEGYKVGVLACDPTSPFSGGALLGDRVRMHGLYNDDGVFIRSLATRGSLGGLSEVAHEVSLLVEAAGYDAIFFETIGVGQVEVDIVEATDTVVVMVVPQSGDAIQALKAGLMEIADIFVVNKADQAEADRAVQALHLALRPGETPTKWVPPIVKTVATTGEGVDRLKEALERHREHLGEDGLFQRRQARLEAFIRRIVEAELRRELWNERGHRLLDEQIQKILEDKQGPFQAAAEIRQRLR